MVLPSLRHLRATKRVALLGTTAAAALLLAAGHPVGACPLGGHDSPRVRLLHGLAVGGQHFDHGRMVAQAQPQAPQTPTKRNELGAYARDLPRGAAGPASSDQMVLVAAADSVSARVFS